ncbi:hypothetical protein E2C01_029121 [Portunus trituberculatus]|uniref:Uncharacterized protein n=1 Tax=Portunus trituberculatus TaxID=210409 RepID=A0A5B7ERZ4_PORTR|nr:hypothetical protein [Portunus trituberculatus]
MEVGPHLPSKGEHPPQIPQEQKVPSPHLPSDHLYPPQVSPGPCKQQALQSSSVVVVLVMVVVVVVVMVVVYENKERRHPPWHTRRSCTSQGLFRICSSWEPLGRASRSGGRRSPPYEKKK